MRKAQYYKQMKSSGAVSWVWDHFPTKDPKHYRKSIRENDNFLQNKPKIGLMSKVFDVLIEIQKFLTSLFLANFSHRKVNSAHNGKFASVVEPPPPPNFVSKSVRYVRHGRT